MTGQELLREQDGLSLGQGLWLGQGGRAGLAPCPTHPKQLRLKLHTALERGQQQQLVKQQQHQVEELRQGQGWRATQAPCPSL